MRQAEILGELWDHWQQGQNSIRSCTIITTQANEWMKPIHHRMPVIIDQVNEAAWLDSNNTELDELKDMFIPDPKETMDIYPVSTQVNHPKNDSVENIQPVKHI